KPNFMRWSQELGKATDGKNIGNVRAMHGTVSAGITKQMDFDDASKQITVKAEITDPTEWSKVLKGNYTGLSIGGRYAEKWKDETLGKTRYAADPSEYSLVDLPCNPDATFSVVKADGAQEMRKFEHTTEHEALAKWADGLTTAEADVLAK
ncbi:phage associated protein, partial [mine drainage metagenome]